MLTIFCGGMHYEAVREEEYTKLAKQRATFCEHEEQEGIDYTYSVGWNTTLKWSEMSKTYTSMDIA